jgi:hypothetical protein
VRACVQSLFLRSLMSVLLGLDRIVFLYSGIWGCKSVGWSFGDGREVVWFVDVRAVARAGSVWFGLELGWTPTPLPFR